MYLFDLNKHLTRSKILNLSFGVFITFSKLFFSFNVAFNRKTECDVLINNQIIMKYRFLWQIMVSSFALSWESHWGVPIPDPAYCLLNSRIPLTLCT